VATSVLSSTVWKDSLEPRLVDDEVGRDLSGYVGGRWRELYPGLKLVADSVGATRWSRDLGLPFHEASVETNCHNISLVLSDLVVDAVRPKRSAPTPGGRPRVEGLR
jgi:hypothetical protein